MTTPPAFGKKTVRDIDPSGQRVLVRADFNVPLENGAVADDTRLRESLPTIRYLLEHGAAVVLCSHLGRPAGPDPALSLRPVATRLAELLEQHVDFADDCIGDTARQAAAALQPGGVLLLENLRFHSEEESNDPGFAKELGSLASTFVNDAFGTAHRAHASTEGVTHHLAAVAGLLLEKELRYLGGLVANPPKPFGAVVGGAKVSSKIDAIDHLLPKLDVLVIGGGMANTFLAAKGYHMQNSRVEMDQLDTARSILFRANDAGKVVHLPVDLVVAEQMDPSSATQTVTVEEMPAGTMALDIGPKSLEAFIQALLPCSAIIWNGPMGVFEMDPFAAGSYGLAKALAGLDATVVVGGGETAQLASEAGVADQLAHVSTGGGASLEMLEGKTLPGVAALLDA